MFENIERKIKGVAVANLIIGFIGSLYGGISLWINQLTGAGFLVFIGGPILSLITSWFIYGFGEMIESLAQIEANTGIAKQSASTNINGKPNQAAVTPPNSTMKNVAWLSDQKH